MRPKYRHEYGAIHQFPADPYLIDWLNAEGHSYDVATDDDLNREAADLLMRYNVVVTSCIPSTTQEG